ncbi:MAG TPA: glycosyltransferase [Candidatus Dormibacteraeota bacterium]|nr:glycosyltransferase [Candidatus Dormibacteraeota bacterium]
MGSLAPTGYHPLPVHIAFLGTRGVPARYSGFETCVEQVGRRMAARGHEVTVFCRRSASGEAPDVYDGMRLRHLPSIHQKHLETLSHTALSAVRLPRKAALVVMGVGNAPVVRLLEARGRRAVFNVDGADWQRDKWGGLASRYLRSCETLAAGGRSILIADGVAVQRSYLERFDRQSELVAYGADAPADRGTEALDSFGLRSGEYLLWVGRLVPENGAHDFLEAVTRSRIDVPAVVVGDAPYQHEYIAQLHRNAPANAIFTGFQFGAAYQQLTAHAGLYVLAATVGGTHPVLVEQMGAGNCVLARDTESDREVLGEGGHYWQSADELAELICDLWKDAAARRSEGARARRRVEADYSWERVTDRYLELCERSLSAPAAAG